MKLDRDTNKDGRGKYALIKLRNLPGATPCSIAESMVEGGFNAEDVYNSLDFGDEPNGEFFVIRLKDKYALQAIYAYIDAVAADAMAIIKKGVCASPEEHAMAENLSEYLGSLNAMAKRAQSLPNKQIPT